MDLKVASVIVDLSTCTCAAKEKNTLLLFLQSMADTQRDLWVPVYSQSSNDVNQGCLPQIPSTPHLWHSASAGNLCAPFFDSPVDFRSPQYVACQPHFHPMQGHSSMMSPLPETPSHKYIRRGCRTFLGRYSPLEVLN